MQVEILRCKSCGKYTLEPKCACGSEALRIIPAKYSPEDKYGEYRRKAKEQEQAQSE